MAKGEAKTLAEICREYNVSLSVAENKINQIGVDGFYSSGIPLYKGVLEECTEIVRGLAPPEEPHHKTPTPHSNKDKTYKRKYPNEYLLRDYIILTHSALRKKGLTRLIDDFITKKGQYSSASIIVMLLGAVRDIADKSKKDSSLKKNFEYIEELYTNSHSKMLDGDLSDERKILEKFIEDNYYENSIIVFGDSDGLSQKIEYLNRSKRRHITIYERDFLEDGSIIDPSRNHVFSELGKQRPVRSEPNRLNISVPSLGDMVYTRRNSYVILGDVISGNGGEGIIYRTNISGKCAKIFRSRNCTDEKAEKVHKMCEAYEKMKNSNPVLMEKIAWPEKPLFNERNQLVGYLMQNFESKNIKPFSHFNAGNFSTLIPNLKKQHQITMAKKLSELIVFLHKNNVILCDINRGNILFNTKTLEAYIVDMDSAQIADNDYIYCCNVGRQEYLSPEHITGQSDFSFVHKKADDVWALQMLLFSILTPLGNAYLTAVDEDESTIIKEGRYPFQAGDNPSQDVAGGKNGRWHIIVSHFPKYLKEYFWESFHIRGIYFRENHRMTARDWWYIMLRYENDIGYMIEKDRNSGEYEPRFPKRFISEDIFIKP